MKPGSLLALTVGVAIGAVLASALWSAKISAAKSQAAEETQLLNHKIAELEQSERRVESELTAARAEVETLTLSPKPPASALSANLATNGPGAQGFPGIFGQSNHFSDAMSGLVKTAMQQQTDGKLAVMKSKLNLTAPQEAAIRQLLDKQAAEQSDLAEKMFKGGVSKEDMAHAGSDQKSEDEQIKALLTPEQSSAYDGYKADERDRMSRLVANSELMQLQSSLQLTDEQQDKVFEVLFSRAQNLLEAKQSDPTSANTLEYLRDQSKQKAEALRPLLSDDQMAAYEKFQEQQLKMMEAFLPKK